MESMFFKDANTFKNELIDTRRYLHEHAETGFAMNDTLPFISEQLEKLGCHPKRCGKAAVSACIGNPKKGKTLLLRADMDALPIREQTHLPFSAKNGNMHACGHDMHATMLLGAAKLLKGHETELCGGVKLLFQPAEETLEGAKDVIESGILQAPKVDAALMLHVITSTPLPTGTTMIAAPGVSAAASDFFTISVQGKGCHGSMPHEGVDALLASAYILIALQELSARELSITDECLLTIGALHAGEAGNVIADTAKLKGTLRSFDDNVQKRMKKRLREVAERIAKAFRASVSVTFDSGSPTLINDEQFSLFALKTLQAAMGEDRAISTAKFGQKSKSGGGEDFAYISQKVPSLLLSLAAGNVNEGYAYPPHHPKTDFDENALPIGAAVYAQLAYEWLAATAKQP